MATNTSSTANAQYAIKFLQSKGWTQSQAAGIVANFQAESGINLNTKAVGDGGRAYGIAQWHPDRQANFQNEYGIPITDATLAQQLEFVHFELTEGSEKSAGNRIRATSTPADAAIATDQYYERSDGSARAKRVTYANVLSGTANGSPPAQVPTEPPAEAVIELPEVKVTASKIQEEKLITKPIPNRLHKYPHYTYGISLHLLSHDEYNSVVINQKYKPTNVLVASAGRYGETMPRNKFFNEDFYFDNLEMTTIIAPNDYSRNTNAIECNFTLIEPYGFTFIERLLKAAEDIQSKNYLDMPFLIQIDFFAMDDAGTIVGSVEELKKRIPVRIIKIDIKANGGGSTYVINTVPFGHSAYDTTTVSTPANFEIVASTVSNFFQSTEGTDADTFQQATRVQADNQRENTIETPLTKITSNSYGSAINEWYKALVASHKIGKADVYRFEFMPDPDTGEDVIGKAKFVESTTNTPKETPMTDSAMKTNDIKMRRANTGDNCSIYSTDQAIFSINYGTTIDKLLEYVIRSSSYIQDQIVMPDGMTQTEYHAKKLALKDKPLNWFRITPKVRTLGFDNIRKVEAREITYVVTPYKMYNIRSDLGPQGVQLFPVKAYNYLYTGKNDDVLDFDIQFNTVYFTQVTAYRDSMAELSPTAESKTNEYQDVNAPNFNGQTPPKSIDSNSLMPGATKVIVQNSKSVATGSQATAKSVAASDLADSLMTSSQADMINLNLSIIGDPDFIKQDDIFYNTPPIISKTNLLGSDPRLLPNNGSLVMDTGGVYAQVIFRTPIDVNENTGLMEFDSATKRSIFSGLYQIIQVKSKFTGGAFTQELQGVRMPRQVEFDYTTGDTATNNVSDNRPPQSATVDNNGVYTPATIIPPILVSTPKKNTSANDDVVNAPATPSSQQTFDPIEERQRKLREILNKYGAEGTITVIKK